MVQIRSKLLDDAAEGKPKAGGQLFCRYLLNRCPEGFEYGWTTKDAGAVPKASENEPVKAANDNSGDGGAVFYSDEY